jgi:hypothetical protein
MRSNTVPWLAAQTATNPPPPRAYRSKGEWRRMEVDRGIPAL